MALRLGVVGVTAAGAIAILLGPGTAAASESVSYTNWNGIFPVLGRVDPINSASSASLPPTVQVGKQSASFPISVQVTAPAVVSTGLLDLGAATITGSAEVSVTATDSTGKTYSGDVLVSVPSAPVPSSGGDPLTATATGSAYIPAISNPGVVTIKTNLASVTLDPKKADGSDTVVGTFTTKVIPDATGPSQNPTNDTTLGTVIAQ